MVDVILKKKSFPIRTKTFSHIDEEGKACYKPALTVVSGEVFDFLGYKWGIYRKEHTKDQSRKNDYVMVDLTTGLPVRMDSRKIYILEDLEMACFQYELRAYMQEDRHAVNVKIFNSLRKGANL